MAHTPHWGSTMILRQACDSEWVQWSCGKLTVEAMPRSSNDLRILDNKQHRQYWLGCAAKRIHKSQHCTFPISKHKPALESVSAGALWDVHRSTLRPFLKSRMAWYTVTTNNYCRIKVAGVWSANMTLIWRIASLILLDSFSLFIGHTPTAPGTFWKKFRINAERRQKRSHGVFLPSKRPL